eukprot:s2049_g7.t2
MSPGGQSPVRTGAASPTAGDEDRRSVLKEGLRIGETYYLPLAQKYGELVSDKSSGVTGLWKARDVDGRPHAECFSLRWRNQDVSRAHHQGEGPQIPVQRVQRGLCADRSDAAGGGESALPRLSACPGIAGRGGVGVATVMSGLLQISTSHSQQNMPKYECSADCSCGDASDLFAVVASQASAELANLPVRSSDTTSNRCRSGLARACWRFAAVAACLLLLADLRRTFLGPRVTEKPLAGRLAAPTPRFAARMPRVPRPAIFAATPAATMFGAACEIASGSSHKLVLRGKSDEDIHWYVQGSRLPKVRWFLRKDTVLRRVLFGGGLALGESYMDGDWEKDNVERLVYELLRIEDLTKELGARELPLLGTIVLGALKGKLLELPGQSVEGAKNNIGKTYDVETIKIYEEMLDSNMQYSCGYFYKPDMTLDDAQFAKMELIARKLDLKPGMKLLEIGFGFGSLAYHLASRYDVHIKACTLSQAQMDWAKEHYGHPNIEFMYADYRDVQGKFDRVYSVGMFEHVGRASFATYFDKVYDALADDGIFLLHTLGWAKRGEWNHNGFVGKYIFPGGELPTLYLLTEEFSDRWHLEDFQSFGKSYVQTMRTWLDNLKTWNNMDEFDTRFKRMWEYYLSCCTAAFEKRRIKVWQFVYTKQLSPRLSDCYHIRRDACSIESLARETEAAR